MAKIPNHLSNLYRDDKVLHGGGAMRNSLAEREIETLRTLMEIAKKDFPISGTFLDLGCGDRYLQQVVVQKGLNYLGYDIDTVNFEKDYLPLESESIDIIVSLAVIEHLRDPSIFMSEIHRCLKPGGVIYICTPNFQYDMKNFYNDPTHVKPFTPAALEKLFSLYKFKNIHTFPGLRCKKKWWYQGPLKYWRANYLLPFRGASGWAPPCLSGRSTSIFALGIKSDEIS